MAGHLLFIDRSEERAVEINSGPVDAESLCRPFGSPLDQWRFANAEQGLSDTFELIPTFGGHDFQPIGRAAANWKGLHRIFIQRTERSVPKRN